MEGLKLLCLGSRKKIPEQAWRKEQKAHRKQAAKMLGNVHGISSEASSAADDTKDRCVSEGDTADYSAAEAACAAAPAEETPGKAAPQSAATTAPESKQEPQPEHEAATAANCEMPYSEQAKSLPATAAATEVSAGPKETASEAASWVGDLSKSQKKEEAKCKATISSTMAAGAVDAPIDKDPSPSSDVDTDSPTGVATEASTGNGEAGTCTPSGAATDSHSDDGGTPAADGQDPVEELQSAAGQERPLMDSSRLADSSEDAAAASATNPAAEPAACSSESQTNTASMADITEVKS